jgi:tripartite-type tricarboxylate transporter receptor subunit TctC
LRTALLAQGAEPAPSTPEEFAAFIQDESEKMKRLIEVTGMRAD